MAKKVREQAIALSSYLKSVNSEDISENQDVQRMFCWDNPAINELIVTVLTEDYIPPIILGEEELGGDLTQQYIVDGIQRTTALNKFRHMNWKTTKSFENSVIQYQAKMRDDEGHLIKDKDGSILWENREFDIKNKTFEQLPDELKKKFDDYQIRIVIHQNCTMQEISKLVRRYNRNKSMGSNQKALTWIPTYARKIKNIANNEFYKNCVSYSKSMRKNGTYEQTVANSVMATFHLNDWKKTPNDRNEYLEENSSFDEFEKVNEYGNRIAKVCGNKFQNIFVFKDILCWIATFDKFTKLGVKDNKFAEFVNALVNDLHDKVIGEWSYDLLDKEAGTSDKKIIQAKIDTYTTLMMNYLHINPETAIENSEETTLSFVQENANPDATEEDIEFYRDMVEDCVRVDEPVYQQCERAVIAIMAYACMKEQDEEFEKWIQRYKNQTNFSPSQKTNFTYMKNSFDKYVKKGASGK
jgi:hypothetical protein|uniref:GmrSD restriction endonucleases N-terminal domain-containing protein n=1 Tax=Siphoviridae sp. ctCIv11 TaxID=2827806 RepID=A0A8S5S1G3_9CAUD|nr:MAG TPA: Protein of unknown function DUF262 [Siphoviridae sp. ctCIv11]